MLYVNLVLNYYGQSFMYIHCKNFQMAYIICDKLIISILTHFTARGNSLENVDLKYEGEHAVNVFDFKDE